ncbi:uncharacterized protein LOC144620667 [Crassostrea virginica]
MILNNDDKPVGNQTSIPSQDAFAGVVPELRKELTEGQRGWVSSFCEELSVERLKLLLDVLFECIMLTITIPRAVDDDVDIAKYQLIETLVEYLSAPQYDVELTYPGWLRDLLELIPRGEEDRTDILNNQAVYAWLLLYTIYSQKQTERRY